VIVFVFRQRWMLLRQLFSLGELVKTTVHALGKFSNFLTLSC